MYNTLWESSHVYGDCLVNHKRGLVWVNIPKCASSWGKFYLARLGISRSNIWTGGNFVKDKTLLKYTPIIWLRDPVNRWISHPPMADKICQAMLDPNEIITLRDTLEMFFLDEHTAPQSGFIQDLDLKNAIYFHCDSSLSDTFTHFLQRQEFEYVPVPAPINVGLTDQDTLNAKAAWATLCERIDFQARFKEIYSNDYNLIDQAKFYSL